MPDDPITELRAMLMQFVHSGKQDLYLRSGRWTVFMALPGGAANPMRQELPASAEAVASEPAVALRAPHLGLFEPRCVPGDMVEEGAVVCAIDVLGRKTEVTATRAGRVIALCAAANDLVEYADALAEIA